MGKHKEIIKYLSAEPKFKEAYGVPGQNPNMAHFAALDDGAHGVLPKAVLATLLERRGIIRCENWKRLYDQLDQQGDSMKKADFQELVNHFPIVQHCVTCNLAIPEWPEFTTSLNTIYHEVAANTEGDACLNSVPRL